MSCLEVVLIVLGLFISHPTVLYFVLKLYFSCPGIVLEVSLTRCRVVLKLSKSGPTCPTCPKVVLVWSYKNWSCQGVVLELF